MILLRWAGITVIAAILLGLVIQTMPGLAVVIPLYLLWAAKPMTWESEYEYDLKRFLK